MKLRIPLLSVLILISVSAIAQPISFSWAKALGGKTSNANNITMARDAGGAVYLLGEFVGTRTFDSYSLTSSGTSSIFVAKYSASGNCLWAVKGGYNFSSAGAGRITVNGSAVYITGTFTNFFEMGSLAVISNGSNDVYIASLNTSDGSPIWLEKAGSASEDFGVGICNASTGGVYICGTFTGTSAFGTNTIATTSAIDNDIFYAHYNASGVCTWAKRMGGPEYDKAFFIKETPTGDLVLTGSYEGQAQFGSVYLQSAGYADYFLVKTNSSGIVTWAVSGGGDNTDIGHAVSFDPAGNIYSTGFIADTAVFGSITLLNALNVNILLTKHNSAGVCQWARTAGNINSDVAYDIVTDAGGSSYITGYVTGDADFSGTTLVGVIIQDGFVAKYDNAGNLRWVTKVGGVNTETGKAIHLDSNGYCFIAGDFDGTFNVTGVPSITAATGTYSVYFMRMGGGSVGIDEAGENLFSVYPNPASDFIQLNLAFINDDIFSLELIDVTGKIVYNEKLTQIHNLSSKTISTLNLQNGTYFLRVSSSKGEITKPVVVNHK
ncbi:MAG: T9SS type A sorting domain-containing protein [Bacteroidota bacterium]|nr:T9SS type A sorting domain-containing protein [Bacteroidota bacterium]